MTEQAAGADGIEYVNVDVEVGILVQSLMFRHRQKQSDLGKILGIGQATISRKLRGDVAFSLTDLMKIGRAYDVDPADLLPRLDSNQQPCGYEQSQVSRRAGVLSSGDASHWDRLFDRCASGESREGCNPHNDRGLPWRDWVNTGWVGRSTLDRAQLRAMVSRWAA